VDDAPGTISVLLVDDHDLVLESIRRALTVEPDMTVVGTVAGVNAALDAARTKQPDVVVMDYLLPDGTGAEGTTKLLAENPHLEVVMLTGQSSGATLADALEAGCSGFVAKEGRFDNLVQAIRAAAAGEIYVPQQLVEELAAHLRPRPPTLGADLTERELEVLRLLGRGASTDEIVDALNISVHTVRNHIRNILTKLNARSRLEAVTVATRIGVLGAATSGNAASGTGGR
jgi:DNA-binding NarL/FixJ family response regulator